MKFWNSLPRMHHERDANCIAEAVYDYFKIKPEVFRIRLKTYGNRRGLIHSNGHPRKFSYALKLPENMNSGARETIEGFIVAYARGFADGVLLSQKTVS